MPRLRITTGLSLLALVVGILGTAWLSVRSDQWDGPRHAVLRVHTASPERAYRHGSKPWHPPPRAVGAQVVGPRAISPHDTRDIGNSASMPATTPALVPVNMPSLAYRYDAVRGHLAGSLVLALTVGADGAVQAVAVQRSSGDPVLDDYASELVRQWRFAVPAGHTAPFEGELPMHFGAGTR